MDGYSGSERLRAQPEFRDIFLVTMTGYGRDEDFQRSKLAGFDRHLVEPIDFTDLQALLDGVGSL